LNAKLDDVPLPVACSLFLLGSAVFLVTPLLLRRRLRGRGRLGWLDRFIIPLLLAPWLLPMAAALHDDLGRFLFGYHLLAAAHTAAFLALAWPLPRGVASAG
jgi:hypothetical protein